MVQLYLTSGPTCSKSAATQMSELVSYLNSNCKSQWSGRVWLDIEGSQYWLGSTSSNQAWYKVSKDSPVTICPGRCTVMLTFYITLCHS